QGIKVACFPQALAESTVQERLHFLHSTISSPVLPSGPLSIRKITPPTCRQKRQGSFGNAPQSPTLASYSFGAGGFGSMLHLSGVNLDVDAVGVPQVLAAFVFPFDLLFGRPASVVGRPIQLFLGKCEDD